MLRKSIFAHIFMLSKKFKLVQEKTKTEYVMKKMIKNLASLSHKMHMCVRTRREQNRMPVSMR